MVRLFGWPEIVAAEPSRSRGEWQGCCGLGICFIACGAIWLWDLTGFTLPCVKEAASGKLLYNTDSPPQHSAMYVCTHTCVALSVTHTYG